MKDMSTAREFPLFPHQIAGHGDIRSDPRNGHILKRNRGNELQAYNTISKDPSIERWFPKFHGVRTDVEKSAHQFLVLEDLTHTMKAPCLMDIKLGRQQHTPFMPPDKQEKQIKKCAGTTSSDYGFRLCGVHVNDVRTGEQTYDLGKREARTFDVDRQRKEIASLFRAHTARGRILLERYREQLEDLIADIEPVGADGLKNGDALQFFSTSLFVAFDGAYFEGSGENVANGQEETEADDETTGDPVQDSKLVVRIIDLGQVYSREEMCHHGHDTETSGFMDGLRSLAQMAIQILGQDTPCGSPDSPPMTITVPK